MRNSPMIHILIKGEMLLYNYGDDDQNDLMNLIDDYKGEEDDLMDDKIQALMKEVAIYKQAIQDAKDALASAEMELDETLDEEFRKQQ